MDTQQAQAHINTEIKNTTHAILYGMSEERIFALLVKSYQHNTANMKAAVEKARYVISEAKKLIAQDEEKAEEILSTPMDSVIRESDKYTNLIGLLVSGETLRRAAARLAAASLHHHGDASRPLVLDQQTVGTFDCYL